MPVYNINLDHLKKIVEAPPDQLITLYTLQHRDALKLGLERGYLSGLKADEDFEEAYGWMRDQMRERIQNFSGEWPVWCHLGTVQATFSLIRIKARVPCKRILLSNYCQWEDVLNLWPIHDNYYDKEYQRLSKMIPLGGFLSVKDTPKEIQNTWLRVFDIKYKKTKHYNPQQVQACVDRIMITDIVEVCEKYNPNHKVKP